MAKVNDTVLLNDIVDRLLSDNNTVINLQTAIMTTLQQQFVKDFIYDGRQEHHDISDEERKYDYGIYIKNTTTQRLVFESNAFSGVIFIQPGEIFKEFFVKSLGKINVANTNDEDYFIGFMCNL